jgi:thiol:disulfide interchange protein
MMKGSVRWITRHERALWLVLFLAIVVVRWPLLKGFYYRVAGVAEPVSTIPWRTNLDAALIEARQTRRPVLVDFHATWCAPCLAMQHDVWTDATVAQGIAQSYIPVSVDVDRDSPASDRFQIDAIPAVLILDANGRVLRRAGYLPVSGMLRFLSGE